MNRNLVEFLSKYVDTHQNEWDKWRATVLFAYGTSAQRSTGYSLYELLFGRIARLPVATELDQRLLLLNTTDEYLSKLKRNVRQSREIVDEEVAAAQERQHRNYDETERVIYEVDDSILLHSPALTRGTVSKLHCSYQGPYQVKRQVGQNNLKIQKVGERKRKRKQVHGNKLKVFNRIAREVELPADAKKEKHE